jgi:S1-C subfamily serine protease
MNTWAFIRATILSVLLLFFQGCATIVSESANPVLFSTHPSGAVIEVQDSKGQVVFQGISPASTTLSTTQSFFTRHRYSVTFRKDGYQSSNAPVPITVNPWYWGNLGLGVIGLIPGMLIVDPMGAMFQIDTKEISVVLQPDGSQKSEQKPHEEVRPPPIYPMPENLQPIGSGSGWFTRNGEIVSNFHVVQGANHIFVKLKNGLRFSASVKRIDNVNDIAVLVPEMVNNLPSGLPIATKPIGMGASVFTIGYPIAPMLGKETPKLTNGIVSAVGDRIQISVPIQKGNSGGALVSQDTGEVVGIIVSKLNHEYSIRNYGLIPEGIAFAVKLEHLVPLLDRRGAKPQERPYPTSRSLEELAQEVSESVVLIETYR